MNKKLPGVLFVLLVALFLRLPLINSGIPYLYDEDEGHHYNRQVEMLKTGDLNPHYFLKPSLNFYLRLPVLSAGFLWSVKEKQALSTEDIRTKDEHGLSGYSFTVSQPAMLKADRLYSVIISLLIIAGIYYLTFLLSGNYMAAFFASLLASFSPLSLMHSVSVGVNQPTALFCLVTVIFTTLYLKKSSWQNILLVSIFAGFAIGTKYNAFPILLLPLSATILKSPFNFWKFFVSAKFPWLIFICTTPFILKELPFFLDHIAYEVWHYGVQGHEGHSANPGIGQLFNYLSNIVTQDIGILGLIAMLPALFFLVKDKNKFAVPAILFLLTYLLLMSGQKVNFERNLLLVLPVIYVLIAYSIKYIKNRWITSLLIPLILLQPALRSLTYLQNQRNKTDSRTEAFNYLNTAPNNTAKLAIDGTLQLPRFVIYDDGKVKVTRPNTKRVNLGKQTLEDLKAAGYQEVLVGNQFFSGEQAKSYKIKKYFAGKVKQEKRVPENPAMWLLSLI